MYFIILCHDVLIQSPENTYMLTCTLLHVLCGAICVWHCLLDMSLINEGATIIMTVQGIEMVAWGCTMVDLLHEVL